MLKSKTDISYSATTFTSYNSSITTGVKPYEVLLTKKNVWCDVICAKFGFDFIRSTMFDALMMDETT